MENTEVIDLTSLPPPKPDGTIVDLTTDTVVAGGQDKRGRKTKRGKRGGKSQKSRNKEKKALSAKKRSVVEKESGNKAEKAPVGKPVIVNLCGQTKRGKRGGKPQKVRIAEKRREGVLGRYLFQSEDLQSVIKPFLSNSDQAQVRCTCKKRSEIKMFTLLNWVGRRETLQLLVGENRRFQSLVVDSEAAETYKFAIDVEDLWCPEKLKGTMVCFGLRVENSYSKLSQEILVNNFGCVLPW